MARGCKDVLCQGITGKVGSSLKSGAGGYRFGFNGKEQNSEIDGVDGTNYDYGARTYDARIGRFWAVDPYKGFFASNSSYMGLGDNPIMFVDNDGEHNTIYLLIAKDKNGESVIKPERAIQIQEIANKFFKDLGLETKVRFFNEEERGNFDVKNIDPTDNVAVMGTNVAFVIEAIRNKVSPSFGDYIATYPDFIAPAAGNTNPELSATKINPNYSERLGIAVKADQSLGNWRQIANTKNITEDQALALFIVHGAGHNTTIINNFKGRLGPGHTNDGVMMPGGSLNINIASDGLASVFKYSAGNIFYKLGILQRYDSDKTHKSVDNYDKNAKQRKAKFDASNKSSKFK